MKAERFSTKLQGIAFLGKWNRKATVREILNNTSAASCHEIEENNDATRISVIHKIMCCTFW